MSWYQVQLKSARFAKKMRYWFVLEIHPRQFADACVGCQNNGCLRHKFLNTPVGNTDS